MLLLLLLDGNPGLRTLASVAILSRRASSLVRATAVVLPCGVLVPDAAAVDAVPPLWKLADREVAGVTNASEHRRRIDNSSTVMVMATIDRGGMDGFMALLAEQRVRRFFMNRASLGCMLCTRRCFGSWFAAAEALTYMHVCVRKGAHDDHDKV